MNIIFCGLPMVGKSTIGKKVAKILDVPFIETDRMVEETYYLFHGQALSCREIAIKRGEAFFREMEKNQIASLKDLNEAVIALGGGSLCDPENAQVIAGLGHLIYLKADPKDLWERTAECGIPSYLNKEDPEADFLAIAEKRIPIFEQMAKEIIDVRQQPVHEIVQSIVGQTAHGK